MITSHQPTIFPTNVLVRISSLEDGSMKDGINILTPSATSNRKKFLESCSMPAERSAVFYATFEGNDYCRYAEAQPGTITPADALVTRQSRVPLFLPLADCTGAVLYDSRQHILMLSHLGRHSTEQFGAARSVAYLHDTYGTSPTDLRVWLSPSPNGDAYPLWSFDNKSFKEVLSEQFQTAGVSKDSIEVSEIDTITNPHYYSHSEYLKGNRASDGRYAIVAMIH